MLRLFNVMKKVGSFAKVKGRPIADYSVFGLFCLEFLGSTSTVPVGLLSTA